MSDQLATFLRQKSRLVAKADWFNIFVCGLVVFYLLPVGSMIVTAFMPTEQLSDPRAPIYPAKIVRFLYKGKNDPIYNVPTAQGIKQWALVNPSQDSSEFVDPQHPESGLIEWQGNWHDLTAVYAFAPTLENFQVMARSLPLPRMMGITFFMVILTELGVLLSSIVVAYGFARFPLPGGNLLFYLMIATIMIPDKVTHIPTYFFNFIFLHWVGTLYPLMVPFFFGNAIYIFLLRQNFKGLPIEIEEAAMLDGAGPLRRLFSIILPQSWPVVVTVSMLHFFYIWNETRQASIYLGPTQQLMPLSFAVQPYSAAPPLNVVYATTLLVMALPVILLFLTQRLFLQSMIITGAENKQ